MKCKQCGIDSKDVPRPDVFKKELSNYNGICLDCLDYNTGFAALLVVPDEDWEDESETLRKAALNRGQP